MRSLALAATLALATHPLLAQDTRELATQYANLPDVQAMWDDTFSPDALAQQFRAGVPAEFEIAPDKLARIGVILSDNMSTIRPELTEMLIAGMAAQLSADELSALITFYQSEHGASVMSKMQPFLAGYMARMMPLMQVSQEEILPEIIAIIEE